MKRIVSIFLILLTFILCLSSCSGGQIINDPLNDAHYEIDSKLFNIDVETPYAELFNIYDSLVAHEEEHGCNLYKDQLYRAMLLGEWKTDGSKYISYTREYSDYADTKYGDWLYTNFASSKSSGSKYYYYTETKGKNLIIGYSDKFTEEKTENYVITFYGDHIILENKIDNETYKLTATKDYAKVQKGNAKLAYACIAKKIFSFKSPSSVVVTRCCVDYDTKTVYATIKAENGFGAVNDTDYKLWQIGDTCYMTESSHDYSTNIDLEELNQKLQKYVSTGG